MCFCWCYPQDLICIYEGRFCCCPSQDCYFVFRCLPQDVLFVFFIVYYTTLCMGPARAHTQRRHYPWKWILYVVAFLLPTPGPHIYILFVPHPSMYTKYLFLLPTPGLLYVGFCCPPQNQFCVCCFIAAPHDAPCAPPPQIHTKWRHYPWKWTLYVVFLLLTSGPNIYWYVVCFCFVAHPSMY